MAVNDQAVNDLTVNDLTVNGPAVNGPAVNGRAVNGSVRSLVGAAALILALTGCGQERPGQAAPDTETTTVPTGSESGITTSPPTSPSDAAEIPVDRLANRDTASRSQFWTDDEVVTTPTTTAPAPTSPAPTDRSSTSVGSGGAPVTTVGVAGGGDLSIYQGVLGTLGRDDQVVAAAAPAPTATPGTNPLTGLPGTATGPAIVVKIDNSGRARPQTGLNAADLVIEEEVEGGITRLAAVFHSTDSVVGPVRSGRTTDIGILNGLGSPLFAYSGANQVTDALLRAQPTVQNRSAASSSGYWRNTGRRAPSNLYTDTGPHRASAAGGPPPAQFDYRPAGAPVPGVPDDALTVAYRSSGAAWTWDGSSWLRSQGGTSHLTASGAQVSAANVVVVEAAEVVTGMVDSTGATVPEFVFVGSGPATVFTAGHRIEGVWTRPTLGSVATLTTADGAVIELTPGRTWIELIGAGAGLLR